MRRRAIAPLPVAGSALEAWAGAPTSGLAIGGRGVGAGPGAAGPGGRASPGGGRRRAPRRVAPQDAARGQDVIMRPSPFISLYAGAARLLRAMSPVSALRFPTIETVYSTRTAISR